MSYKITESNEKGSFICCFFFAEMLLNMKKRGIWFWMLHMCDFLPLPFHFGFVGRQMQANALACERVNCFNKLQNAFQIHLTAGIAARSKCLVAAPLLAKQHLKMSISFFKERFMFYIFEPWKWCNPSALLKLQSPDCFWCYE